MNPMNIKAITADLPHMRLEQAIVIYEFIKKHNLRRVLELGFLHGVSSLYIAGAIDELDGSLTTIDRESALDLEPNIRDLANRAGLSGRIKVIADQWSYTYHLMTLLESGLYCSFDMIYVDGGHTWDTTGFATCLAVHLLKPNGWLILDDLDWTISKSIARNPARRLRKPSAPQDIPGVRKAFELLVKSDHRFSEVYERHGWGFARKSDEIRTQTQNDRNN
jgi:predicted O-methyltransferase YrrM